MPRKSRIAAPGALHHIIVRGIERRKVFLDDTDTIRLPNELKSDLQRLSQEQNKPVSYIVRESIRRYVAVEKFRALRKKALPFAEAQGFLTDEDIFRAIS